MWPSGPGPTGWPGHGQHYPPGPAGPYSQPGPYPDQFQPPPPRVPRPSPFAGVPRGDFALDATAVAALLATLLLPWTVTERGYSRPEVIVGVVLGLCAIGLPYLSRMRVFGPGWTPAKLRIAKLVVSAPLGLCAAAYFVIDAVVGVIDAGVTEFAPAPGAWIAAATSVLAALPRRSDLIDGGTPGSARRWATALTAMSVALPLCAALALLGVALGTFRSLSAVLELRALVVLPVAQALLFGIWVIAVWKAARQASHGDAAARLVLSAAGAGALTWAFMAAVGQFTLGTAESLHLPFAGFTLTMAAALVASSPTLRQPGELSQAQVWLGAARGVLGLVIVANLLLLGQVIVASALTGALTAVVFTTVVCAGAGAVAADWARQQITVNSSRCRIPVLVAAVVQAVAGVALILVTALSPNDWEAVTGPQVIAALALPAAAAAFVTLPPPVRSFFPPPAPAFVPPATSDPASVAANPATPAHVLYSLAQQDSTLWPHLAANPAAPHDLLAWLYQSSDPAVHSALRARQR